MRKTKRDIGSTKRQKPDELFVVEKESGLLDFLLLHSSQKSRNNVKSLLTRKVVLVDDVVTTRHDHPLQVGQIVRIDQAVKRGEPAKKPFELLYEDEDMIVINKPAGLLSIATEKERDQTAYHLLMDYVKRSDPNNRILVVHRLDRDTSGVLMVAKNEKMKLALQDNWEDLVSQRGYVAVVEGRFQEKTGRIQSWLNETSTHLMYSSFKSGDGLKAITKYTVLKENASYSLVDIRLETGRKNQIRVHMKDLGHSIAGDKKYGAMTKPFKRLGLHAHVLELKHPFSGEMLLFEAPLPTCFKSLFK